MNSANKMKKVFQEIIKLEFVNTFSKNDRIVNGILNAIDENILKKNDPLPSVNSMIKELGFARQTIASAYQELVHKGVVESKNRVGYFVASKNSNQTIKVALVLYAFDTFQETFYENFRKGLGENVQLDIYFHHYNWGSFKSIVEDVSGKYGMYVIASIP
ncbi:MAG: winged helix-turn-helix domain-containing protein, partial [Cyclobacteriaceae bacterium]